MKTILTRFNSGSVMFGIQKRMQTVLFTKLWNIWYCKDDDFLKTWNKEVAWVVLGKSEWVTRRFSNTMDEGE